LLLDPGLVPGPSLLAVFGINVAMAVRDRRSVSFDLIGVALLGRAVGTVLALAALAVLDERGLSIVVAVVVLGAVAIAASGVSANRSTGNLLAAGSVSGVGATTAGIGGPPVALLFRDAPGDEVRGSLGAFFVVGNTLSLAALSIGGLLGAEEVRLGLLLAPAAMAGFACTRWTVPLADRGFVGPAILVLSSLAALASLVRLAL
jgi:hypothetical protein